MEAAHARVAAWTSAGARPDDGHLLLSPFGPAIPSNPSSLDDPSSSNAVSPSSALLSATASSSNSNSGSGWNHVGISEVSAKDDFGKSSLPSPHSLLLFFWFE
jgi:hypothetical protein